MSAAAGEPSDRRPLGATPPPREGSAGDAAPLGGRTDGRTDGRTGGRTGARTLLVGPPGSGKTREVLARFDGAVRAAGADRAFLLLPTYGDVEHARRTALSRTDARGLLDAPYATFTSLAERTDPDFRVRDLPSRAERDLLADAAISGAGVEAFRRVADRPGFRARFLRLVKEWKQSGEDPIRARERARAALGALDVAARERLEGFLAAWEAYDALLARLGRRDHEDALRRVEGLLRAGAAPWVDRLAFLAADGFEDLTGLEFALFEAVEDRVRAAGGEVVVTLPFDPARAELAPRTSASLERFVGRGHEVRALAGFARRPGGALAHLATRFFRDGAPGAPVAAGEEVGVLVGADEADEADRIGREILRLRAADPPLAWRDVAIVVRRVDASGVLVARALERLDVPVSVVGGGPRLQGEACVRAFRGPASVLADPEARSGLDAPFDPAALLDYLRWRAHASGAPVPAADVDAADLEWRRKGFPATLEAFRAWCAEHAPALRAALDGLDALRAGAATARGGSAVAAVLRAAIETLLPLPPCGGFGSDGTPLDPEGDARLRRALEAKAALLGLVADLDRAAAATGLLADLDVAGGLRRLREAAATTPCRPPDRRLDVVHVMDAEEARHWEAEVVFVAGLVEGEFPLRPREDVFVRDDDREALANRAAGAGGPRLSTAREARAKERRLFLSALTRARRRVVLSRSLADAQGRERAPSPFWRELDRRLRLERGGATVLPSATPSDVHRVVVPPEEAVREDDLLAFAAERLGAVPASHPEDERVLALAIAREAGPAGADLLRRASRFRLDASDPLSGDDDARLRRAVASVGATQVNAANVCLRRHFLAHVVRVPDDDARFAGRRLDARDRGRLVHDALCRAVRDAAAAPDAVARAVVAAARLPADPRAAFLETDLARIVRLFREREAEAAASGFVADPAMLEFTIVSPDGRPVTLGEGADAFAFTGKVDRLDVRIAGADGDDASGERLAIVVDYKTRGDAKYRSAAEHLRDLQLPLYARAVERAYGVRVVGLEWYGATRRGRWSAALDPAHLDALARRSEGGTAVLSEGEEALPLRAERRAVERLREARSGGIGRRPTAPKDCDGCAVRPVCRPHGARIEDAHAREVSRAGAGAGAARGDGDDAGSDA